MRRTDTFTETDLPPSLSPPTPDIPIVTQVVPLSPELHAAVPTPEGGNSDTPDNSATPLAYPIHSPSTIHYPGHFGEELIRRLSQLSEEQN